MRHLFDIPGGMPACCVAVGRFEGVHRGHLDLARHLAREARARGLTSVLVSLYDPDFSTLTTEKEKALLFEGCGVDTMVSLEATSLIRAMSPATFTHLFLKNHLNARYAVTGEAHKDAHPGLDTIVCPMVLDQGLPLSTQRLLDAFQANDLRGYAAMCGRPYPILGTVVQGRRLGRTVGMPTANLELPWYKLRPAEGVYATLSTIDGALHMGLTNVGRRPTVDNDEAVSVETHLLDLDQELYGAVQLLEVCFYVRGIMKFEDLSQVKAQVDRDKAQVRDQLAELAARRQAVPMKAG